jgi:SAM-dependent methyltransferase
MITFGKRPDITFEIRGRSVLSAEQSLCSARWLRISNYVEEADKIQRAWRIRIPLFLFCGAVLVAGLVVGYQAMETLRELEVVERERDRWQRPADVIAALNVKEGSVVADIGSGVGYFSLKLAPVVGRSGEVLAVDILREPLAFLWIRALAQHSSNLLVIHADADDPPLPKGRLDAVLIANTYHEFTSPEVVLVRALESLRPGGRLVVVDRGPLAGGESREEESHHHERIPAEVENEIRRSGFEVISRDDHFIVGPPADRPGDQPDDHVWWLIVAKKP